MASLTRRVQSSSSLGAVRRSHSPQFVTLLFFAVCFLHQAPNRESPFLCSATTPLEEFPLSPDSMQRDQQESYRNLLFAQSEGTKPFEDKVLPKLSIGYPPWIRGGHRETRRLEDFDRADDPEYDENAGDGDPEGSGTEEGDGSDSSPGDVEGEDEGSIGEDGDNGSDGGTDGDGNGTGESGSGSSGGNSTSDRGSDITGGDESTGSDHDGYEGGGGESSVNDQDGGEDAPSSSGNEQGSEGDGSDGGSDESGGNEQDGQVDAGGEGGQEGGEEDGSSTGDENPEDGLEPSDSHGESPARAPVSSAPMPTRRPSHSHSGHSSQSSPHAEHESSGEDSAEDKSYVDLAKEEYDSMVHDRNVAIVASVFGAIGFILLLITAQQIIENPDGCCARLCRFSIAFWRVVCWPCRKVCCRGKKRRGHTVIADDGYAGYSHDLELS